MWSPELISSPSFWADPSKWFRTTRILTSSTTTPASTFALSSVATTARSDRNISGSFRERGRLRGSRQVRHSSSFCRTRLSRHRICSGTSPSRQSRDIRRSVRKCQRGHRGRRRNGRPENQDVPVPGVP